MARTRAGVSVTVDAPAGVTVTPRLAARGPGLGPATAPAADPSDLGRALAAAELELAADFDIERTGPGRGPPLAAGAAPVTVKVDVKANESALLLVETEGGVFAWQYPTRRVRKLGGLGMLGIGGGASATLVFELSASAPRGAGLGFGLKDLKGSPIWNWVVDKAIGAVRTRVLKFVVGKIEDAVVDKIEGQLKAGLTSLAADDPLLWRADGAAPQVRASAAPRVLLMVHGTFSTTTGSFQALTTTPEGKAFLAAARARYDAILGFDHKTLALGAEENAAAMLAALDPLLPAGATLDAIAYSRGGLVYRVFAEKLLPARRPDVKLGKAVFVGCTNGGTHLAEPDNWEALVDLYTNIIVASSRVLSAVTGAGALSPVANQVIETIARFVKYFAVVGVTERGVPGLADMEPDSALVKALNGATVPGGGLADYFAITSNFKASFDRDQGLAKELKQMLLDKVVDQLFRTDNDLVVDTASMTHFGARQAQLQAANVFNFGDGEDVFHTVYFGNAETVRSLRTWLG